MIPKRLWSLGSLTAALSISFFLFFLWTHGVPESAAEVGRPPPPPAEGNTEEKAPERPPGPIYKNLSEVKVRPPIKDNFPLADSIFKKSDFPSIASWNKPPTTHVKEKTPLFIGFTRAWPLLQQCVLSYITSGWPPEDIYVVENTGTMHSNKNGQLSLQNPFFLNHTRLELLGVNVIITPTLFTFAQLQNFYIFTAIENGWDYYFWSHMDVLALTEEKWPDVPFKNLYTRAVETLRTTISSDYLLNKETGEKPDWAIRFFAYDWLALNNVKSFVKVGGWDTFVSFYLTDCDMHERFHMNGMKMEVADTGRISDVGGSIDLNILFRRKIDPKNPPKTAAELDALPEDERGGLGFEKVTDAIQEMVDMKAHGEEERNSWQYKQQGGQGDPFYRDPRGFETALQMMIQCGVTTYKEKWGHEDCGLRGAGLKPSDAWMVEHDWEDPPPPPRMLMI